MSTADQHWLQVHQAGESLGGVRIENRRAGRNEQHLAQQGGKRGPGHSCKPPRQVQPDMRSPRQVAQAGQAFKGAKYKVPSSGEARDCRAGET